MSLRLNGSSSGYTELTAPAVAGNTQITVPDSAGTTGQIVRVTSPGVQQHSNPIQYAGIISPASGNQVSFSNIPSWARRLTLIMSGVSTNGASLPLIQIGTGGFAQVTGYNSSSSWLPATGSGTATSTAGFVINSGNVGASFQGTVYITSIENANVWVCNGALSNSPLGGINILAGGVQLSGTLDFLRLTTSNGTDLFDVGSVNLSWE